MRRALLPTFGVTRIPPLVIVLTPVSVSVLASAALKRRLFVVAAFAVGAAMLMVVLFAAAHASLV